MRKETLSPESNSFTQSVASLPEVLRDVCQAISAAQGRAWLVGGCVRDMLLGIRPKDFDLEVYRLNADQLTRALTPLGRCQQVGKQFGVLKLWHRGMEIDIALPRREKKTGAGHRGFEVICDPALAPEIATRRRDFTINAMMLDPLNGELLDLHHGREDLSNGLLRHVSPAFAEDPLRPLRAMQFAARFRLRLAGQTCALCKEMLNEADSLAASRIWLEWQKWSHADHPSHGLQALHDSGWLALYPEIGAMQECPQDPQWHPEGNVWNHTLQVVDQAAGIAVRNKLDTHTREHLIFAALCHDMGKPRTTVHYANDRIGSPGHSEAGMAYAARLLKRIHAPGRIARYVQPLIKDHITHLHGEPSRRAVRRLAHRLHPAHIELWEMLVEADASGRAPAAASRPALPWLQLAMDMQQHQKQPKPILTGRILLGMGVKAGPEMGEILSKAYQAQLDGVIKDEVSGMHWCREHLSSIRAID